MNKYLIEILKLRTSVTLPGFGALMIANSRTGKIVLNQLLKYDDKVLAKFIAEKENIDLQEAQNMVSKFVKEIDLDISKGETYDIFQFGKLSKTENGSIVFEMDDSMKKEQVSPIVSVPKIETKVEKPKASTPKIETKKVTPKVDVKPIIEKKEIAPKVERKSIEKPKAIVPKVEKKKEVIKPEVKEATKNVYRSPVTPKIDKTEKSIKKVVLKEAKVAVKVDEKSIPLVGEKVKSKVIVVKTEPETKPLSAKEKAKLEKEANKKWQKTQLGDKAEKKKRKVWPWILLLLLIGFGISAFMFQDKLKVILGMTEDAERVEEMKVEEVIPEEVVEVAIVDTMDVDTSFVEPIEIKEEIVSKEVIEEEVVEPVSNVQTSTHGSYHIIGGAFGEEANAAAFASKTGGTVLGRFNGMYQVAVRSYNTRSEVNSAFSSVSSEYSGAWIFKYPK